MPSFYGRQDLYVDEQRSFSHVKAHSLTLVLSKSTYQAVFMVVMALFKGRYVLVKSKYGHVMP